MIKINIPSKDELCITGLSDPARFYYHPILKYPFLKRLELLSNLFSRKGSSVLDIGYGSGIFFLELSNRFNKLFGIDLHDRHDTVEKMLTQHDIAANLITADVSNIPYPNNTFDCVFSLSTLEHVNDLPKALREICRVLKDSGEAILGFPSDNLIMRLLHYVFDSTSYSDLHISDEKRIINEIKNVFKIEKLLTFPFIFPPRLAFYIGCRCIKKNLER